MSAPVAHPIDPAFLTTQNWGSYSSEDHEVWSILYERRMNDLRENGSEVFLTGAEKIGLSRNNVPNLEDTNRRLRSMTGWSAIPVTGFIPAREFFQALSFRRFPTTVIVRPKSQLDYLPEPDIFHDVFGHVPLHSDPVFADFLQKFGEAAAAAVSDEDVRRMARLFWFTVEFGLIRQENRIKVYGSGLISSAGDCANALGPKCDRRPFDLDAVLSQHFEIDSYQDVLFVVESFDQLFEAVKEAKRRIH